MAAKQENTLGIEDLNYVFQLLKTASVSLKWQEFGLCLGLNKVTLDKININCQGNVDMCLLECLSSWLKRTDNVDVTGLPSLTVLVEALEIVGDTTTADLIRTEKDLKVDLLLLPNGPPDRIPYQTKGAKTPSCLHLFGKYVDRFRDIISTDEKTCNDFVMMLRTEQLISMAEKNIADRMTNLTIKTNMLLRAIRLLMNGKNPETTLRKVILIAEGYDCALFEDITQDMNCSSEFCLQDKVKLFSITPAEIKSLPAINHGHQTHSEEPIKMFSEQLKSRYRCEKAPDLSDYLLPIIPFVEPVMVEIDPDHGHNIINSNIESIKRNATTVSMHDLGSIPRGSRYLIEGSAGFGKTKLAFELRDRWVNGRALLEYSLFLLVQLRGSIIQNDLALSSHNPRALKDFIAALFMSSEHWNDAALQNIIDTAGDGLFILFEGYNELKNELVNESIFLDIIKGRFLPKATVLVTSRPLNTFQIKRVTNNLRNVQVVGFDKTAVDQFIAASFGETECQYFNNLPKRILSCLYIPIVLCLVAMFIKKQITTRDDQVSPLSSITKLYQWLINDVFLKLPCPENSHTSSAKENCKLNLSRLAWNGISNNEFSFESESYFESLGLMQKEHCHSSIMKDAKYSFLHVTIQEFLAANFVATKFPDQVKEVFHKCSCHPEFSGTLIFLAGLMPQREDIYLPVPKKIRKFDILHLLYEAQCTNIVAGAGQVEVTQTFPSSHDMLALGYCISKTRAHWILGFTIKSLSKEHIEMMASGFGANSKGKIKELNLSLNELGCESMTALLTIPIYVFQPLTLLNFRGCGLSGQKTSSDVANFFALLPSLQKFYLHDNLFDMEQNEQLPIIEAICRSKKLISVSLSNLSPKECNVLLSHEHKESLKKITLYQLHCDSIQSSFESLTKSSINTLKVRNSHLTPLHSRILPAKLRQSLSSIKILDLSNCAIDDETLEHIANAIVVSKVDRLSLNDNLITDDGCPSIIQMIESKRLHLLQLQRNNFSKDTARRIASSVSPNPKDLKLYLSLKWMPYIDIKETIHFD